MEVDSYLADNLEAYTLLFHRCRFGFTSKINMDNLKYFSIPNQQRLGKIDIRLNINAIRQLPNKRDMNFLVMTEYQQIIPLIYFLRSQNASCKILTTKSMLQFGKIYAQDFYQMIKKMNQIVSTPTYQQESEVYDNYELQFQIDFSFWVNIFNRQEIDSFAKRCICLNYGQVYDTDRGILITGYPSGMSIGSAVWLFENTRTKSRCLWVQGISHHTWRACQQFCIKPRYQQINYIIFTMGVLANSSTSMIQDEHQCFQFLKTIFNRLNKGHNTRLVIHDFLLIADIINQMTYEFKEKFKKLYFTGCSINNLMSYANSYIQFLTTHYQQRIYEEQPVHPFQSYEQLRDKVIVEGTLEDISADNRVPVKQLILRSTPYILFEADFYAFLVEGDSEVVQAMFEKTYDLNKLRNWLESIKVSQIAYICKAEQDMKNIPDLGHSFSLNLIGGNIYLPEAAVKYYTVEGPLPGLISQYTKKNGWLRLNPVQKRFRELKKDWQVLMAGQLAKLNIETVEKSQTLLATKCSKVVIKDYKIHIHTNNQQELQIIDSLLSQCSSIFKLG